MPKAKPETCPHPRNKWATKPSYGHTLCTRCGEDLTPANRIFEYRAGPRTTFRQGDRIHVKGTPIMPAYKATFQWAEEHPTGVYYCVFEKQTYKEDGKNGRTVEGTAAIRMAHADLVRHDDGKRIRDARAGIDEDS